MREIVSAIEAANTPYLHEALICFERYNPVPDDFSNFKYDVLSYAKSENWIAAFWVAMFYQRLREAQRARSEFEVPLWLAAVRDYLNDAFRMKNPYSAFNAWKHFVPLMAHSIPSERCYPVDFEVMANFVAFRYRRAYEGLKNFVYPSFVELAQDICALARLARFANVGSVEDERASDR